jgi:hypothetical protein
LQHLIQSNFGLSALLKGTLTDSSPSRLGDSNHPTFRLLAQPLGYLPPEVVLGECTTMVIVLSPPPALESDGVVPPLATGVQASTQTPLSKPLYSVSPRYITAVQSKSQEKYERGLCVWGGEVTSSAAVSPLPGP